MVIPFPDTDIYCITDSRQSLGRGTVDVVARMLEAGIKVLQYREKDRKAGEMLRECRAIRRLTRAAGCCFLVNDYLDIALLCEADGVHLGQDDIPLADARRLLGPERVIGISTHRLSEARAALAGGADYIGVGPIFPTATKTGTPPVGYAYLEEIAAESALPFVTIGGINERTVSETVRRGARCCGIVSDITSAGDIPAKIERLRALIRAARAVAQDRFPNAG
ncbi:MAG: thiamine phosphate synthase [Desulfovibrio sp.]|jgi:thiamine-phosphate pyrophosphorylase|nr:thiamine phosphate synthase [Desulfovibrio sp.]